MTHLPSKFNLRSVKQHARPALCNRPCRDEPWSSAPSILLTFLSLFLGSGVGLPRLEKNGGGADGHLGNNPGWSGVCLAAGSSSGRQGLGADAAEMSGYCKVLWCVRGCGRTTAPGRGHNLGHLWSPRAPGVCSLDSGWGLRRGLGTRVILHFLFHPFKRSLFYSILQIKTTSLQKNWKTQTEKQKYGKNHHVAYLRV